MTALPLLSKYSFIILKYPVGVKTGETLAVVMGNNPCKSVTVTTAWRVLRLRMEERPPIWSAAANTLNKQSRTADKGWSSSLGFGRGANNASPSKKQC
jgi:hypothetical protein